MELDFNKYCRVDGSPNTVLLSPRRCSKVERRSTKGKPTCINEEDFVEIKFRGYRSSSCKNIPSRTFGLERNEVLKRGSVYQSSSEVRKMNENGAAEGRRKIELSESRAINFSLEMVDPLCSYDEDRSQVECKMSSVKSINSDLSRISVPMANVELCPQEFSDLSSHRGNHDVVSSDGLSGIPLNSNGREHRSAENVERENIENTKFRSYPIISPINDGNGLRERDAALTLHKSLSAKLVLPHSTSQSENDSSRSSSPKSRFSPFRKLFDPFSKSKSQRSPLGSASGLVGLPPARPSSIRRNTTLRKSLLNDFSNTTESPEFDRPVGKKGPCNSAVSSSPAHLHGFLKLENKQGVPFFEFSLKCPEEVLVARSWKADDALNWAYTFHNRVKSNSASGWGLRGWNKESNMVGQMQVSCYLSTELQDADSVDNSMVTEFVLYDVAHARHSVAAEGKPNQSTDAVIPPKFSNRKSIGGTRELDDLPDQMKLKPQPKQATEHTHFDSSTQHPWASTDLHPSLEIAAIVIQVPFEKRESLKHKGRDAKSDQPHPNLLDLSASDQSKKAMPDCLGLTKVNVVTPYGNHSLPSTENCGPSPLLDRWRLSGGCDCGGWDMACPLTVFGNPNIQSAEVHPLMENQPPLELFVQGAKEKIPALMMKAIEEGRYSVDFHAQLSALQAFSICVAILHCTEASIAFSRERDKQLLQCNSLRVFIEEEVKNLIEAVTEEEKKQVSKKKMEEIQPSFKLNPPFSPIARV